MSGIDWGSGDVVLACQLLSATALAVHLLVLRPRGARQDLLLDARIVQDELDLAERLGHVGANQVETVAVQQVLRRVRQNPRSAELVLARIPALAHSARQMDRPTDAEYLEGALDRLSDAAQRYLRGAWPRAGALSGAITSRPATLGWEMDGSSGGQDESDPYNPSDVHYLSDQYLSDEHDDQDEHDDSDLEDYEDSFEDEDDLAAGGRRLRSYGLNTVDDLDDHEHQDDHGDRGDRPGGRDRSGDEYNDDHRFDRGERAEADGSGLRIDLDGPPVRRGGPAAGASDWNPTWVDLVQAETPRRTGGLGLADRHARPYRPARSAEHSSARRLEQPDRSSVLPR